MTRESSQPTVEPSPSAPSSTEAHEAPPPIKPVGENVSDDESASQKLTPVEGDSAAEDMDDVLRSEGFAVAVILFGLLVVLSLHVIVGRWRGGELELQRLPEHQFDFRIDINTAKPIELIHLPGVGPALAERIIENREQLGPFRSAADLQRVRGIGPRLAEQIAPYVEFPPAPP